MRRIVVKVGGGMLARIEDLDAVLAEVAAAGREHPVIVVPGGGPFADAVRELDRRLTLTDDAAHWMAVLAMDQFAHLLASRLPGATLVFNLRDLTAALEANRIPVLAPFHWLHKADPLPHSWDITSDSISAWVACQVGASRLVLVKPAGASGPSLVDPCFERCLAAHIRVDIFTADRIDLLRPALS